MYSTSSRRDFTAVHVENVLSTNIYENKGRRKQSVWRWLSSWSRFQRRLTLVLLLSAGLMLLVLFYTTGSSKEVKSTAVGGSDEYDHIQDSDDHFPAPYSGPRNEQQRAVVAAFRHAWKAYKKYAWGHDELQAESKSYHEWFGLGLTLLDSLDTMYIMGLSKEFTEARNWVASKLHVDIDRDVNLFETTIRALGGLLTAYHLSKDKVFLNKARDLGDRLMAAFNADSKVPFSEVNLYTRKAHTPMWSKHSVTAEIASLQLEFTDLSRITGNPKYEEAVTAVMDHLVELPKLDGLVPVYIHPVTGQFKQDATVTLGSKGDSYYEYLLKLWIQTGKVNDRWKRAYERAVTGIEIHLAKESQPKKLLFIGELYHGKSFFAKMDHLVCFLPGTLALGYLNGLDKSHLKLSQRLADTCYQMYAQMPTFLSPETVYFNTNKDSKEDFYVKLQDRHNLQRPEFIETLFYLYRTTGHQKYQDWGWRLFKAFEKYTKLPEGYTAINNVMNPGNVGYRNKMESFFLGETLKYFYLLFSNDKELLPLDRFVFNTEAHALPIHTNKL